MKAQDLKNSILQMAMEGKLVPQDPNDEPAIVLLERIREEKEQLIKEKKIKRNNKEYFIFRKNNHFFEKVGKKGEEVCIDEKIPFHIPDTWEWVYLSNVLNIVSARRVHQSDWKNEGIPFYRAREIGKLADYGFVENELFISKELYDEFKEYGIPKANDLMVTGVGTLGKTYIVKENDHFYYKDASVLCFENFGNLNPYFLRYLMQSEFMKNQIKNSSSGTTVATITMKKANKYLMPLPPLNEQKRIVEKIEELSPLIKEYGLFEEELDKLNNDFPNKIKDSILQDAIQGKLVPQDPNDESASVLLERIKEEKEQLIKAKKIKRNKNESVIFKENNHFYEKIGKNEPICIDDEIPIEIPESWEWCRLGSILTKLTDGAHKRPKYLEEGVPFLSVKDISGGKLDFSDTKFISKTDFDVLYNRCNYEKGDILLTKVGTTGIPVIIDTDAEFGLFVSVALLKFNHELIFNEYLKYLIESPLVQKQCDINTKGVGNKNWVLRDISNTLIVLPPIKEQKRIVKKIDDLVFNINNSLFNKN